MLIIKNESINLRSRIVYIIAVALAIILGLCSREYSHMLPVYVADNAGDMLWAMMVYFGFRFLFVGKSLNVALLLSILFCFGIEFSQLYQEEWINQLRNTMIGALILGKGFLFVDLIRYTVGIGLGVLLDKGIMEKKIK